METLFARVVEVPVSQSTTRPNFITVILISEKKKKGNEVNLKLKALFS